METKPMRSDFVSSSVYVECVWRKKKNICPWWSPLMFVMELPLQEMDYIQGSFEMVMTFTISLQMGRVMTWIVIKGPRGSRWPQNACWLVLIYDILSSLMWPKEYLNMCHIFIIIFLLFFFSMLRNAHKKASKPRFCQWPHMSITA